MLNLESIPSISILPVSIAAIVFIGVTLFIAIILRRVVPTNEVHIIQARRSTTSYGKDTDHGNVYYEWPTWIPYLGVTKTVLSVSVFDISLRAYEAYDVGRVPFVVDVVAFFRVADSNITAQRVSSFAELRTQLTAIVQGAIRTVLALHDIDEIMSQRSKFGAAFTNEIHTQLENWGVVSVKNLELMDIRDASGDQVIHNIMQKKKSLIEMQSRSEVAKNMRDASIAEINASKEAAIQKQNAEKEVGVKTAEKAQFIGISQQQAEQAVKEQEKTTREKAMEVERVNQVKQAEISRDVQVVAAEQNKQTTILVAEGNLESRKREAEGIKINGDAKAAAETAILLAPVTAQTTLAKEIGSNENYQKYLITIRQIESTQAVGMEQAQALTKADVKIIANTGDPVSGVKGVMDLFTSKGGTNIGAMLEGLSQTEQGKRLVNSITAKNGADNGTKDKGTKSTN